MVLFYLFLTDGESEHTIRLWKLVPFMCSFLVETGDPPTILSLLQGLSNIFLEVGQELNRFESLLVLSRCANLFTVLQRLLDLKLHEDVDIARISSIILRQLKFSEVQ